MKRLRVWIALGLLMLPIVARTAWFYRGVYQRQTPVPTPDYASLTMPVPPLATAQPEKASAPVTGKVVALDQAHDNLFGVTEIEALAGAATGLGARLEIVTYESSLTDTLKYASAYMVIAPSLSFTPEEIQQVRRFVERGGRLLVLADPTRMIFGGEVAIANSLLTPYDLSFSDDYLYNLVENEGNYRNVLLRQFAALSLTKELTTVAFYAACSVNTTTGTPLIQGDERTLSSRTDTGGNLAAAALSANQQVLALGDLTFLTPPYYQVANNARLIRRVAEFLVSGERTHDLADAPFLFSRPVAVVATKSITLTADMAEPMGKWQTALRPISVTLNMTALPAPDSDVIVLGSYTPSDDLMPYVMPFLGVSLTETAPITGVKGPLGASIQVPGLGKVARSGTGLMLFSRTEKRSTLILLADTPEGLSKLVEMLATGDLTACAVQERVALCSVGKAKSTSAP